MLYFWLGVMGLIWLYGSVKIVNWLCIDRENDEYDYLTSTLFMIGSAALFHWVVSIIMQ